MKQVRITIAQQSREIDADMLEQRVAGVMPEPVEEHFVVVAGTRYPPKQVISLVTGIDRADFNTHQARRILSRLGFTVGRRVREVVPTGSKRVGPHGGAEADMLRPYMGRWVAQRGLEVIVAADTPREVLEWLEQNNQHADAMFRVPGNEVEATGLAPS